MEIGEGLLRRKPGGMGDEEWRLRIELAACYRIFDYFGWTELIYNHITLRVPGPERHYLINPFGLNYNEVTATNLIKVRLDGTAVDPSPSPVNKAGFIIHGASTRCARMPTASCTPIPPRAWRWRPSGPD